METEKYLVTRELADFYRVKPQTILRSLCINGHYLNIRPITLPNGRKLWPKPESLSAIKQQA